MGALIREAEKGSVPHAKAAFDYGGLDDEPGSQPESGLAALLLDQLRIEKEKSPDEPVETVPPALK